MSDTETHSPSSVVPASSSFSGDYSVRFVNACLRIHSDRADVQRFVNRHYPRLCTQAVEPYDLPNVAVSLNTQSGEMLVRTPSHRYVATLSDHGLALRCENLASGAVETIRFGGELKPSSRPADALSALLTVFQLALLRTLAGLLPQHYLLHGAAVRWDGAGLVLLGGSGFGKTSLSLALVKHGFRFLSDEVACLGLEDGLLQPFPRSLNVRQQGLPRLQRPLGKQAAILADGPVDVEAVFPGSLGEACPLRCVILLDGFAGQPALQPLARREALWRALPLSHTPLRDRAQALWRLASVFEQAVCYELVVGDLDETARLLRDLFTDETKVRST